MSAPHTDPERQVRRHWTPIVAMLLILLLVAVGFLWWFGDETSDPEMPGTTPVEEMTDSPAPTADPAATRAEPTSAPTQ